MTDDPEYQRLNRLFNEAVDAGNCDLASTYFCAVIARGDQLIAALGGHPMFTPIAEALESVEQAS